MSGFERFVMYLSQIDSLLKVYFKSPLLSKSLRIPSVITVV